MLLMLIAEVTSGDPFPWPVSLGISGISLGALISFFVWQNKQISNGRWVPGDQVRDRLAEKDAAYNAMVVVKDAQIVAAQGAAGEWRQAAITSEEGRGKALDIAHKAVESNKLSDHFYESFMPKLAPTPQKGDTGAEEVSR